MYKLIRQGNLPNWIKYIMYILLTVTCVYWVGYFLYKILNFIRFVLHTVTTKEHWWFTVFIVIGLAIALLIFMEYNSDTKPITMFIEYLKEFIKNFREKIGNLILGS